MKWISVKDKLPKDIYPITDVYEYAKEHYSKSCWNNYKGELRCDTKVIVGCYSKKENKITGVYLAWMSYIPRLGWKWNYSDEYLTDNQITHWMPLPEPPMPVDECKEKTIQDKLDALPEVIEMPSVNPLEDENEKDSYVFEINKDDGKYVISYYCWLRDNFLIEFEGSLDDTVSKMYEWYKEYNYINKQ